MWGSRLLELERQHPINYKDVHIFSDPVHRCIYSVNVFAVNDLTLIMYVNTAQFLLIMLLTRASEGLHYRLVAELATVTISTLDQTKLKTKYFPTAHKLYSISVKACVLTALGCMFYILQNWVI